MDRRTFNPALVVGVLAFIIGIIVSVLPTKPPNNKIKNPPSTKIEVISDWEGNLNVQYRQIKINGVTCIETSNGGLSCYF